MKYSNKNQNMLIWGGGLLILLLILYVLNQFLGKENFYEIPNCAKETDVNQKHTTTNTSKKAAKKKEEVKKDPKYRCDYCKKEYILKDNQCNLPSIANCPYKDRGKCVQECNKGYNSIYVNTEDNIQKCVASRPSNTYEYIDPIDNNKKKYIEANKKYIYLDPADNNTKIKYVDSCPANVPYIYVDPKDNIQKCVASQPSNTYEYTDIIDNNRKKYINDEKYNIYEDPTYNKIKYVESCPEDTFIYYMDHDEKQRKCVKTCPKYNEDGVKSISDKNKRCNHDRKNGGLADDFCNKDSDCDSSSYYCKDKKCTRGTGTQDTICVTNGYCAEYHDCIYPEPDKGQKNTNVLKNGKCIKDMKRYCSSLSRTYNNPIYDPGPNGCNENEDEKKKRCIDGVYKGPGTNDNYVAPLRDECKKWLGYDIKEYKDCMKKMNCESYTGPAWQVVTPH